MVLNCQRFKGSWATILTNLTLGPIFDDIFKFQNKPSYKWEVTGGILDTLRSLYNKRLYFDIYLCPIFINLNIGRSFCRRTTYFLRHQAFLQAVPVSKLGMHDLRRLMAIHLATFIILPRIHPWEESCQASIHGKKATKQRILYMHGTIEIRTCILWSISISHMDSNESNKYVSIFLHLIYHEQLQFPVSTLDL